MISKLKKMTPEFAKSAYHKVRGFVAAAKYGFPAQKMIVIGITGTKGKTSTGNYIWSVLHAGGYKAGLISSANFRIDTEEMPNPYHMTMPDPFLIQAKMREMLDVGVTVVTMEMTSEGMKQYRHTGIPVDIAVFTNLTPEHLSSHSGDFQVYKRAKAPLFRDSLNHANKIINGKKIPRAIIANDDSEHAEFYLQFPADQKITYGIERGDIRATAIIEEKNGTRFVVSGKKMHLAIPGIFNVYNALPACIVGTVLGVSSDDIEKGLSALEVIPGRMELINEGQDFTVVVDYAHEPASLGALLKAAESLRDEGGKTILLTGVIGGGRESRKPLAKLGAERADFLIIANEDPYDEDPEALIRELLGEAEHAGKLLNENLFGILDRRDAIRKALNLARAGDIVLISGKGAEQTMITKDGAVPWNERAIVRELVQEYIAAK
jgi:UDP-N-acetylmuramoyl-L-alanyl-D-glutamate--2,6-diaminopimelate ligase